MKTILANWNIIRVIRLILGLAVLVTGIIDHEWLFAIAGGFLSLFAITNTGCCGPNGCAVDIKKGAVQNTIHIKEIDTNERVDPEK